MKRIVVILITIVFCISCSNQKFVRKIAEDGLNNTLDGNTFLITLVAKHKPDSADYRVRDTSYYQFLMPLINQRVVLCFDGGTIHSSWVSDKKFGACVASINNRDGKAISFSTFCTCGDAPVTAIWTGIVKGNHVRGTFSWLFPDNKMIEYTFRGVSIKKPEEKTDPDKSSPKISL